MKDATGLLLVHAFPADASMWDAQTTAFMDRKVVAPSLPGFGGTPVPATQPSFDDYADFLARRLDDAGLRRAVYCGLSMGGYIGFAFWRRHRDRVAGFLLADTKAEADTEQGRAGRVGLAAKVREQGTENTFFGPGATPPAWLKPGSEKWDALRTIVRHQDKEAVAQAAIAMGNRPDSTRDLATINVPTMVVVGDLDTICTPENAKTIADAIPGATLGYIHDAGHLSNLEHPEAFNSAILELLKRVGI